MSIYNRHFHELDMQVCTLLWNKYLVRKPFAYFQCCKVPRYMDPWTGPQFMHYIIPFFCSFVSKVGIYIYSPKGLIIVCDACL